jgi:hypothetical protein
MLPVHSVSEVVLQACSADFLLVCPPPPPGIGRKGTYLYNLPEVHSARKHLNVPGEQHEGTAAALALRGHRLGGL